MTHAHPAHAGFADAYSRAWTSEPVELLDFFAAEGTYTDVPIEIVRSAGDPRLWPWG
jgi:hypothetical protein